MEPRGAVAVVTGASSGIGAATALALHEAGARLVLHGRDTGRLAALAERTGGEVVTGDLADTAAIPELAREIRARFGEVDVLVNNAGIGWAGPFEDMAAHDVRRVIEVNLTAPIELTRALLPALRSRPAAHVVFVTSIAGRTAVAGESVYSSVKAGLDAFAESLRFELAGTAVKIGVVVPGVVDTEFFARRGRPYERNSPKPVPAGRVADAVVRAVREDRADQYVPRWLRLPVVVRGVAPGVYRWMATRFGGSG
ncbi:SDR family NAD(P)-dependent oxidoreductase [Amycolatopsis alkalitolerans]|uniref:SDR family NAD(P)-dependent oxidoreductase n=1 Tax=Amycolatopsis alkalitolerans TaxID=2547244 RepID=A0A5C4LVE6_9PSEU|nr:SDR family NAD(P)-dependent oxidoreductase [Amycolatopsis alkalitolerans]TNC23027.1 SDR family NAD(P)-dependent oxidoreductase [Amycolatopsis alkalitolerans]